ncbi:MAG: transporter [Rariglobus sp.]|jgi:MFS family permease|nr:transporter [Rariglobus sp.]
MNIPTPLNEPAEPARQEPPPAHKTWKVGTLAYTTGGVVALFALLLWGDFAWSMRDRSVMPMAQWYLKNLGVSNVLYALLISSFPVALGVLLGPVISVKSDRHRGKWGRRIPFLLVTTPIAAFAMIGLGVTPIIAKWAHGAFGPAHAFGAWLHGALDDYRAGAWLLVKLQDEVIVSVLCFGVFWALFEIATIVSQSVFGGLINDVVPKPLLGRFYGLFRAVSLIDGMIFNYWIMGKVPAHFTLILCSVGVFYGVAFLWVCLKVKEGDYPPPPEPAGATGTGRRAGWAGGLFGETKRYCKECFTNPYYLSVFVLLKLAALSFGPINTFAIPYARSLGIDMEVYGKYLALTYLISLSLSFFIGWLADVAHPLRLAMIALAGYVLVTAWGSVYATTPNGFLIAWVAHGVLSGTYMTSAASLGQRLFPHSRFAQFASAATVFVAFANMVMAPLMGLFIDQSGGIFRHTFTVACGLAMLALIAGFYVHAKFMKLGGPRGYVAPE